MVVFSWYEFFSLSCCNVYLCISDSYEQSIFDETYPTNQIIWLLACCRTEVIDILVTIGLSNVYALN